LHRCRIIERWIEFDLVFVSAWELEQGLSADELKRRTSPQEKDFLDVGKKSRTLGTSISFRLGKS
jgi:hypothetical protein